MVHKLVLAHMQVTSKGGKLIEEHDAVVLDGRVVELAPHGGIDEERLQYLSSAVAADVERISASMTDPEKPCGWQWTDVLAAHGISPMSSQFRMTCEFLDHVTGEHVLRTRSMRAENLAAAMHKIKPQAHESLLRLKEVFCDGEPMDLTQFQLKGSLTLAPKSEGDGYVLMPVEDAGVWIQVGAVDLRIHSSEESVEVFAFRHLEGDLFNLAQMVIPHQDAVMPKDGPAPSDKKPALVGPRV